MRTGRYVAFASVLAALVAAVPAEAVPAPHIAGAQVALRAEGLYRGAIDGIEGPQTVSALKSYQKSENVTMTGKLDPATAAKLGVNGPSAKKGQSP